MPDIVREFSYTSRKTLSTKIDFNIDFDDVENKHAKALVVDVRSAAFNLQRIRDSGEFDAEQRKVINREIKKLDSLKQIIIPLEDESLKKYLSFVDEKQGVTEKDFLFDEDILLKRISALKEAKTFKNITDNIIRANGILKYPKKGSDTEVQREGIGLKIARLLDFPAVTESTLVSHDTGSGHHPCLFVPFGDIDLLTESIDNPEKSKGLLKPEKAPEIEDFGKYSAFFMLCGDPDFIGKDGQNKGLTKLAPGSVKSRKLYIFDQVFMAVDSFGLSKFSLDKAFNIEATHPLATDVRITDEVSRHHMGRNKSVINDSSYEEKVKGALNLLAKEKDINSMFKSIAEANLRKISDPNEARIAAELRADAKLCYKTFTSRIKSIKKLFPAINVGGIPLSINDFLGPLYNGKELLGKAMLVNQLMNKTKLFDDSDRPYRVPFFSNPEIQVNEISLKGNEVKIKFGGFFSYGISDGQQKLLEEKGFKVSPDGKSATITKDALLNLDINPQVDKTAICPTDANSLTPLPSADSDSYAPASPNRLP